MSPLRPSLAERIATPFVRYPWILLLILVLLSALLAVQSYFNSIHYTGPSCWHYSNYLVFKYSHHHLLGDLDLYSDHLTEHCFTFKYSPAFALFFGVFANLPTLFGMVLWMTLSGFTTWLALRAIPVMKSWKVLGLMVFILFEWMVCVQGQQTNALIAAMFILGFSALEKQRGWLATLLIVATGFIKIFGFGVLILLLFYPNKLRNGLWTLFWVAFFALIPLVVLSPQELWEVYGCWMAQVSGDFAKYSGMSFYSLVESTTGYIPSKPVFLALSLALTLAGLLQVGKWKEAWFRQLTLAALMVWFVLFNHKSESVSYVISMVGIALWYFSKDRKWGDTVLLIGTFLLGSFLFSDFVPRWLKHDIGFQYSLKALPALVVWGRILVEMWMRRPQEESGVEQGDSVRG